MKLRVIGDVHGCVNTPHPSKNTCYRDIVKDVDFSVQLGDMAFNYVGLDGLSYKHIFIPGNHDNYDAIPLEYAVEYGPVSLGPFRFFVVRGEWSIDIKYRHKLMAAGNQKIWWAEEELTDEEMNECLDLYLQTKPRVVFSHGCPGFISEEIGGPGVWQAFGWDRKIVTKTQTLLNTMWEAHQPELWGFGHYHKNWSLIVENTKFFCVDELNYVDFNEDWSLA